MIPLLLAALTPALAPAPARADDVPAVLREDFEGPDFTPGGGLFYKNNEEQNAGSHIFTDATARSGERSIGLSVAPQCAPDNELCSERAEVWERPEVLTRYGTPVWYAFAMKMAEPVPTDPHRYVMAQWKREIVPGAAGDYSPLLALRLIQGRLAITADTDTGHYAAMGTSGRESACLPGEAAAAPPDEFNQFRSLIALEPGSLDAAGAGFRGCAQDLAVIARGGQLPSPHSGWIDFVFLVKPGPQGDGRIEIVANGEWVATATGRIGHDGPGLGDDLYFKFGPYRAGKDDIWRLYYDDFRRGPACTDVAPPEICARLEVGGGAAALTP